MFSSMKKTERERFALCPYFASLLYDLRTSESQSQEKFAEILILSIRSYSNEERGHSLCSTTTLLRVLDRMEDPRPVIRRCVELLDASKLADPNS